MLGMLNKSGLRFNENENVCFSMTKWYETICLDRLTTSTEDFLKRKAVNRKLYSDFSTVNTERPITTYSRNSNKLRNKEKYLLS